MVYKRYIKRNGKRLGPYYYESYRDKHGRVVSRYLKDYTQSQSLLLAPTEFPREIELSYIFNGAIHDFIQGSSISGKERIFFLGNKQSNPNQLAYFIAPDIGDEESTNVGHEEALFLARERFDFLDFAGAFHTHPPKENEKGTILGFSIIDLANLIYGAEVFSAIGNEEEVLFAFKTSQTDVYDMRHGDFIELWKKQLMALRVKFLSENPGTNLDEKFQADTKRQINSEIANEYHLVLYSGKPGATLGKVG